MTARETFEKELIDELGTTNQHYFDPETAAMRILAAYDKAMEEVIGPNASRPEVIGDGWDEWSEGELAGRNNLRDEQRERAGLASS